MSSNGVPATVVPWPGNYDVEGVPAASFTPGSLSGDPLYTAAGAGKIVVHLYTASGSAVASLDELGENLPRSTYYDTSGRRKQLYWADGTPASSYWPDGTQIPLYDPWGGKLTDDVPDPLWTEPEDPGPEDPEPEDPAPLVSAAELQAFMPDDELDAELCALAVEAATAVVAAYCRDRHLDARGRPRPGVKTVALTVAARIAANPSGISRQDTAGSFSTRRSGGFTGFTLAELTVLKRYRRKAVGP